MLVYPDRAEENLRRLIAIAGGTSRLRPHMKTHKLPEIARMHVALGLTRVKCATIAEAEMLASEGLTDVLLAYQPVGPAVGRLLQLAQTFPGVTFRAVVDDEDAARALSAAFSDAESTIDLLVDLDVGMHRTGIAPELAPPLYRLLATLPGVTPGGLHAYDGHLRDPDLAVRRAQADAAFAQVRALRDTLQAEGLTVPRVVVGGTPTLPCHATREEPDLELSPGTVVFWDAGYTAGLPDMDFLHAALLLTRVVSKPGGTACAWIWDTRPWRRRCRIQELCCSSLRPRASSLGCRLRAAGDLHRAQRGTPRARDAGGGIAARRRRASTASRGTCARPSRCTARPSSSATPRASDRWHVTARERMITV